jgi:hypothetical protein
VLCASALPAQEGIRPNPIRQPPPKVDLSRVKPLTDMDPDEDYKGFKGGLYPGGKNERPAAHEAAGVALARQVRPLDPDGKPSADGKIVLLAVGMSNTNQSFAGFMQVARGDKEINPRVVLVNGAQGGMTAALIQNLDGGRRTPDGRRISYWAEVDNLLGKAGATRAQVQAVWIKQADAGPGQGFPKYAQTLQAELAKIVQLLHDRFPNLKLVYLSSRTYGGWAKTRLNPEPYAYESGFSVKWLIEQQLKGDPALNYDPKKGPVKAPWLSWGPYLWAKGGTPRGDGFRYDESDFQEGDRTHQSPAGQRKVGKLLLQFFQTDSTAREWFVRKGANPAPPQAVEKVDTSGPKPLTDLGQDEYQGFKGGLYPDGKNERPAGHQAAGMGLARTVQPLDADGQPSADGKIVLLGVGFSNTVQAFDGFMQVARDDKAINPRLVLVNGAVGGMSANMIQNPDDNARGTKYWKTVDERLQKAGVTRAQVQVVWVKETNPAPHRGGFPKYIQALQSELARIAQVLHQRFPNLKLVYLSSRTYGGWARAKGGRGPGNSEPFSYETGFAVKWLIEQQLKGDPALNYDPKKGPAQAPWLSWGPYLWANGTTKRADGFRFELDDFREDDRMHESPAGQRKVGTLLLQFFKNDKTTKEWFVGK